ncbi:MAG: type II toxin-antitoxin system RatA family toxin [Pseudomonadota bacterium]
MPTVIREALVRHARRQMFDLVDDVPSYPAFLPWCDAATVLSRRDGVTNASLSLSRAGVQSTFTTRNTATEDRRIDIELQDGPFEYLRGRWTFEDQTPGTRVRLELRYQFSNPLMGFVLSSVVEDIAGDLVNAFRDRADAVYARG